MLFSLMFSDLILSCLMCSSLVLSCRILSYTWYKYYIMVSYLRFSFLLFSSCRIVIFSSISCLVLSRKSLSYLILSYLTSHFIVVSHLTSPQISSLLVVSNLPILFHPNLILGRRIFRRGRRWPRDPLPRQAHPRHRQADASATQQAEEGQGGQVRAGRPKTKEGHDEVHRPVSEEKEGRGGGVLVSLMAVIV